MCGTCGCSEPGETVISTSDGHVHLLKDGTIVHHHHHEPDSDAAEHGHHHRPPPGQRVESSSEGSDSEGRLLEVSSTAQLHDHGTVEAIEARILEKNDRSADRNRRWLGEQGIVSVNLMSSPGAGKTSLLERTLRELKRPSFVVEGDQETPRDAERIRATGAPVVQINTGRGCHLEADMVWHGLESLKPTRSSLVFIENVGNLVCPAMFDLGEAARVVLFSVTEGEDKPLKYPHMFRVADLVLLSKTDLLPFVDFDYDRALSAVREVNPGADVLTVSSKTGKGLSAWYGWLDERNPERRRDAEATL